MAQTLTVKNTSVSVIKVGNEDFLSLTDIARFKSDEPNAVIANWLRNRNTIEYLGIWESLYNPDFTPLEVEGFKKEACLNAFTLSPSKWIESTGAIGIVSKSGRYGGTYAHKDIAFKFASWISVEFELYVAKEFQRLKEEEQKLLGWSVKRELSKLNYHIHTDAIKQNLIPPELTAKQKSFVYAEEADVLNNDFSGVPLTSFGSGVPHFANAHSYTSFRNCFAGATSPNAFLPETYSANTKTFAA